ncbi:MAG TPA: MinD/ParA family protein, partial [Mycobacterium sp.]|nr:MinD/ParA family protein [Mycobacterium sp.]
MSDQPSHGFRSQQRFNDPASEESQPPEWTAPTPPNGLPISESEPDSVPPPYPELSTATLLRQAKPPPSAGWRRWLYLASGKQINLGESPKVNDYNDLLAQVNRPLHGCY